MLSAPATGTIAAIVTVAGAEMTKSFRPSAPVALLHVHSVDDPRARYAGGQSPNMPFLGGHVVHRPVEDGLARWREVDGCSGAGATTETKRDASQTATLLDFGPCADGTDVELWKLTGVGHGWPGSASPLPEKLVGPPTNLIHAADEIFRFAARFTKPDAPALTSR